MAFSRGGTPYGLLQPSIVDQALFGAPINTGVPVLDQDINLMNAISAIEGVRGLRGLMSDGWLVINDFVNFGINVMEMEVGGTIVFGFTNRIDQTKQATNNRIEFASTSGRALGTTQDLVFVEFWCEHVTSTDTLYRYGNVDHPNPAHVPNTIIDPDVGVEAATRLQRRYRIRTVAEANAMTHANVTVQGKHATPESTGNPAFNFTHNSFECHYINDTRTFSTVGDYDDLDGFVLALPVALVERTVTGVPAVDDDLNNATITDLREHPKLRVSNVVPLTNTTTGTTSCGVTIDSQIATPETVNTLTGNIVTVDFCDGNVHFIDLATATGDVTVNLNNPIDGGVYFLSFKQHPTSAVQLIWPSDVDFVLGTPHLLSTVGGDVDVFLLVRTSNPSYRVFAMGPRTFATSACQEDITVGATPITIDFAVCDSYRVLMTATTPNPFDITLVNGQAGGRYTIKFVQPNPQTVTPGPPNFGGVQPNFLTPVYWMSGNGTPLSSAQVLTAISGGRDLLDLYYDGDRYCIKLEGRFGSRFIDSGDVVDTSYVGKAGRIPTVNATESGLILDTFSNLLSSAGLVLNDLGDVNTAGATGGVSFLEFDGVNWVPSSSNAVVSGTNVGSGSGLFFKDVVGSQMRFRELLVTGGPLTVTTGTDEVNISTTAEVNNATNVGSGTGTIYTGSKTGDALQLKSLIAGSNIAITNNANDITIDATGGVSGETNTGANVGTGTGNVFRDKTAATLNFRRLQAGSNVNITTNTNEIIISASTAVSAVGSGDLTTATGTTTAAGNIVMNDYNFFPNTTSVGNVNITDSESGAILETLPAHYSYTSNHGFIVTGDVARFALRLPDGVAGTPTPQLRCEWRYVV